MMNKSDIRLAAFAVACIGSAALVSRNAGLIQIAATKYTGCSMRDVIAAARQTRAPVRELLAKSESGFSAYDTEMGRFWIPSRNQPILAWMIDEQRKDIYGDASAGVHSGDVVLDCGANVGVFTRKALSRGAAKVVSIEPAPENLECLRRNFPDEINSGRVVVYAKGVWNKHDFLRLQTGDSQSGADSVALTPKRSHPGPLIELTTIDTLVDELHLDKVDFIKMDIEGAERQALSGAVRSIARFRPRMAIELEHRKVDADELPKLVHRLWPAAALHMGPCDLLQSDTFRRLQPEVLFVSF